MIEILFIVTAILLSTLCALFFYVRNANLFKSIHYERMTKTSSCANQR